MLNKITHLGGLGNYLLNEGYIDWQTVSKGVSDDYFKKNNFIVYLLDNNFLTYPKLAEATARYFNLPYFDLNNYKTDFINYTLLTPEFIIKNGLMPLFIQGKQLFVGVAGPLLPDINEINFLTGLTINIVIVEADKLSALIQTHFNNGKNDVEINGLSEILQEQEKLETDLSLVESNHSPIVQLLNKILLDAVKKNASDIHFEMYEDCYRIRFRIDGILYDIDKMSLSLARFFNARLKVLANLDISERRLPQDGRFKVNFIEHHPIDFRISTCPTLCGEKIVLRILRKSSEILDINTLGMNEEQLKIFEGALSASQGFILVTGPTGSGKTITLYTALEKLNKSNVNILSVEDPIEIYLPGINQVQTNSRIKLTFANVLRAFLRQDPDIIMVGEIRDLETAEIAISAAQTGHLVLSTLHTNDVFETLTRLKSLGLLSIDLISSLTLIVAQRLVRLLCYHCKEKSVVQEQKLLREGFKEHDLNDIKLYRSRSCQYCQKGFKGRTGIYEILPISKNISELIFNNANSQTLLQQAQQENFLSLRQSALCKVKAGLTTIEEINRVVKH